MSQEKQEDTRPKVWFKGSHVSIESEGQQIMLNIQQSLEFLDWLQRSRFALEQLAKEQQ